MTPSNSPHHRPLHPPLSTIPSSATPALAQIATLRSTRHIPPDLSPTCAPLVARAPLSGTGTSVLTPRTAPLLHIILLQVEIELLRPANP
jgi:hypothetical protein